MSYEELIELAENLLAQSVEASTEEKNDLFRHAQVLATLAMATAIREG